MDGKFPVGELVSNVSIGQSIGSDVVLTTGTQEVLRPHAGGLAAVVALACLS